MTKGLIYREDVEKVLQDEMRRLKITYDWVMKESTFNKDYSYLLDCLTEVERLYELIGKVPTIKEGKDNE